MRGHRRRANHRLVKTHRSYSVEEAADLLGVHKNTVRAWLKAGLRTCDGKGPTLIIGPHLREFLKARRVKAKQPLNLWEMYCLKCRDPKRPWGNEADYEPMTAKTGNLKALCPDCERGMNRRVNLAQLAQIRGKLAVTFQQALPRVSDRCHPSLNSDSRQEI